MKLSPKDGWTVWLVLNDEGDHLYTVDLTALDGNGECDCPNFQCVRWPRLRDGKIKPGSDAGHCKHINAVRALASENMLDALIQFMVNREKGPQKATKEKGMVHAATCPFCGRQVVIRCTR